MSQVYRPPVVNKKLQIMGALISAARRAKGVSQQELATRIGVSRKTAYRLEQGDPRIAWGSVMTACWLLGIPSDPEHLSDREISELLTTGKFIGRVAPKEARDDF